MGATIRDVAKLANTSKSTVSRYLNGQQIGKEARESIERVIEEIDYHRNVNARRLVTSKTLTIGVVVEEITNVYYTNILRGIEQIANEKKFNCVFYSWSSNLNDEASFLDLLPEGQVDGLILISFKKRNPSLLNKIEDSDYPIVLIGDSSTKDKVFAVDIDNSLGISEIIKHLYHTGHQKIAYISGPDESAATTTRLESYKSTMREMGLYVNPEFIIASEWTNESGYLKMKELLTMGGFTAVVASSDETAIGAIQAIKEAGLQIPEEISVVGFDDIPVAKWVYPSLSTVSQPLLEIGIVAAKGLFNRIENKKSIVMKKVLLNPKLVIRQSSTKKT